MKTMLFGMMAFVLAVMAFGCSSATNRVGTNDATDSVGTVTVTEIQEDDGTVTTVTETAVPDQSICFHVLMVNISYALPDELRYDEIEDALQFSRDNDPGDTCAELHERPINSFLVEVRPIHDDNTAQWYRDDHLYARGQLEEMQPGIEFGETQTMDLDGRTVDSYAVSHRLGCPDGRQWRGRHVSFVLENVSAFVTVSGAWDARYHEQMDDALLGVAATFNMDAMEFTTAPCPTEEGE